MFSRYCLNRTWPKCFNQKQEVVKAMPARTSTKVGSFSRPPKKHVTFVIPPGLDLGIEMYCATSGRMKNEVAAEALREYLKARQQELVKVFDSTMAAIAAI